MKSVCNRSIDSRGRNECRLGNIRIAKGIHIAMKGLLTFATIKMHIFIVFSIASLTFLYLCVFLIQISMSFYTIICNKLIFTISNWTPNAIYYSWAVSCSTFILRSRILCSSKTTNPDIIIFTISAIF